MVRNVISVIDGAAGSCGKAKVIGEIATDNSILLGAAVTNCMPNAGHTFVDEQNHAIVFRNIPVSSVNPMTELFIGPGSAIDMKIFMDEYNRVEQLLGERKIYVHEMVPLIEQRHQQYEKDHITSGSTFKGCGAVSQEKIVRDAKLQFFKTFKNAVVCSNDEWLARLYAHLDNPKEYVLLEGAQGCDLDLNHSGNYPYVTSRNVSSAQLLADSGISPERLLETILTIRPFPIRISNITQDGKFIYAGSYGSGSQLTYTQLNVSAMMGSYPFPGDVEVLCDTPSAEQIDRLLLSSSATSLKQVFGNRDQSIRADEVTLLEALELERLLHNDSVYSSEILDPLITNSPMNQHYDNTLYNLAEKTSVTHMERTIFDLDSKKLKNNCRINTPYGLYLNFFEQLDLNYKDCEGNFEDYYFNRYLREYMNWIETETNTDLLALGTGARNGQRILKKSLIKR